MVRLKQPPKAHTTTNLKMTNSFFGNNREEQGDELDSTPQEISRQRDPDYQLHKRAMESNRRYQSAMENIFEKYARDFGDVADEIDLRTGEIVVNRGHLEYMRDEGDVGIEDSEESEDDPPEKGDAGSALSNKPNHVFRSYMNEEVMQEARATTKANDFTKLLGKAERSTGWIADGEQEAQDGWEDTNGDDSDMSEEEEEDEEEEQCANESEDRRLGQEHNQSQRTGQAPQLQVVNPAGTPPFPFIPFPFFPMAQQTPMAQNSSPLSASGSLPFAHGTDITQNTFSFGGQFPFSLNSYAYYMNQWIEASQRQQQLPNFVQKTKPRTKVIRNKLAQKPSLRCPQQSFTSIWAQDPPQRKSRAKKPTEPLTKVPKARVNERKAPPPTEKTTAFTRDLRKDKSSVDARQRARKPGSKQTADKANLDAGKGASRPREEINIPLETQQENFSYKDHEHKQTPAIVQTVEEKPPESVAGPLHGDAQQDDGNRRRSGRQRKQTDFLGMTSWWNARDNKPQFVVEIRGSSPSGRDTYYPVDVSQQHEASSKSSLEHETLQDTQGTMRHSIVPDSQELSTSPVPSAQQERTPNKSLQQASYSYSRSDHGAALSDDSQPVSPAVVKTLKLGQKPKEDSNLAIQVAEAFSPTILFDEEQLPPNEVYREGYDAPSIGISGSVDCIEKDLEHFQDNNALPDSGIDVSLDDIFELDETEAHSEDKIFEPIQSELIAECSDGDETANAASDATEDAGLEIGVAGNMPTKEQKSPSDGPQDVIPNSTDETSSSIPAYNTPSKGQGGRSRPKASMSSTGPTSSKPVVSTSPNKPAPLQNQSTVHFRKHCSASSSTTTTTLTHTSSKTAAVPSTPHRTKTHLKEPSSRRSLLSLLSDDEADDLSRDVPSSKAFSPSSSVFGSLKLTSASSRRVWKKRSAAAAAAGSSKTPTKKRKRVGHNGGDDGGIVGWAVTPGGSKRKCGVDGVICGREFCFSCVV